MKNKKVQWNTDNLAVASIVPKGSGKLDLHRIAIKIAQLCTGENISLKVEWIPRGQNNRADHLSRILDFDDWSITQEFFSFVSGLFGPFEVDRFADHKNSKCADFNSKHWVPGTSAVDAFNQDWGSKNNWVVPPVGLAGKVIKMFLQNNYKATMVLPKWPSQSFWPILFPFQLRKHKNVKWYDFFSGSEVFQAGMSQSSVFSEKFTGQVIVVHIAP